LRRHRGRASRVSPRASGTTRASCSPHHVARPPRLPRTPFRQPRSGGNQPSVASPATANPTIRKRHDRTIEKPTSPADSASIAPERHPANDDQPPRTPGVDGFCVTRRSRMVRSEQPTHRFPRVRVGPSTGRVDPRRPNCAGASTTGRAAVQSIHKRSKKGEKAKKVFRRDHPPSADAEENPYDPIPSAAVSVIQKY
jgi:hypothetical protein